MKRILINTLAALFLLSMLVIVMVIEYTFSSDRRRLR